MTDQDHDNQGRVSSGMAFRFRAGEEDLEEVSIESESGEHDSSLHENFQKILQLPRKLLNKDHSLSDSEDTSESSRLSEWWKDAETSKVGKSDSLTSMLDSNEAGLRKRTAASTSMGIKVSQGRIDLNTVNYSEVEAGIEIGEDGSLSTPTASAPTTPTRLTNPTSSNNAAHYPQAKPRLNILRQKFGPAILWCLPFLFVSWLPISSFWSGAFFGITINCLLHIFWDLLISAVLGEPAEVEKGPFTIPDYSMLPPLKIPSTPREKRGVFNVYNKPYDPDSYTVSQTRAVCLSLDGRLLRVTKVKTKLTKRAHFSEPSFEVDSTHEAIYNLAHCSVQLLPNGLTRKRLFSKKYPITVILGEGAIIKNCGPAEEPFHAGWEASERSSFDKDDQLDSGELDQSKDCKRFDSSCITPVLYLFARCDRDKEDWFRRLLDCVEVDDVKKCATCSFLNETDDGQLEVEDDDLRRQDEENRPNSLFDEYLLCMSKFASMSPSLAESNVSMGELECAEDVQWFNAFINRILFDVFRSPYWVHKIQEKLQKKLSSLRLPYYVEEMQITELDLGTKGPLIHRVSQPVLDERGIWFDLALSHPENMRVTIQTKLNLQKLQQGVALQEEEEQLLLEKTKSPLYDSEAEDSAESSSDEDSQENAPPPQVYEFDTPSKGKRRTSGAFFRIVENVAKSRAFRHVAQTKVVQKVIANVSQTKLRLQVDVHGILGTMAVNLPPPPSDRLWYGFRGMPKLWIKAKPLVGEWNVNFSHVTNWIEKKLLQEFQKLLVIPNMDDLILPLNPPLTELSTNISNLPPPS